MMLRQNNVLDYQLDALEAQHGQAELLFGLVRLLERSDSPIAVLVREAVLLDTLIASFPPGELAP